MTHRRPMNEDEQRAHDVIAEFPAIEPDPDFRARLRAQFVAAQFEADQLEDDQFGEPSAEIDRPANERTRENVDGGLRNRTRPANAKRTAGKNGPQKGLNGGSSQGVRSRSNRSQNKNQGPGAILRSPWSWVSTAAAAILVGVIWFASRPGEAPPAPLDIWTVVASTGDIEIDDGDGNWSQWTPETKVTAGQTIRAAAESEFTLERPGSQMWVVTAGTEVQLPLSGRAQLTRGELRVSTGPSFPGLTVATPEAELTVVGTTFAAIRDGTATCLCVFEGTVSMRDERSGEATPVSEGFRRIVTPDNDPEIEPIAQMEAMKLQMLQDQAGERFGE